MSLVNEQSLGGIWKAKQVDEEQANGETISSPEFSFAEWLDAEVPGTVLGALVAAGVYPDPFYGTQNERIPDASHCDDEGAFYTYWFATSFELTAIEDASKIWLDFRGINYTAQVFMNGQRVGSDLVGMFQRHTLDISDVAASGTNHLAVRMAPPWPPGKPTTSQNGGQPGEPNIAENVTMRYTVGWDWVQPVRDRNCGIWDQVTVRRTGPVRLDDPHVVTTVLDAMGRLTGSATVALSAELYNPSSAAMSGTLTATLRDGGETVRENVTLESGERRLVSLPEITVDSPKLWWPNGLGGTGPRELSTVDFQMTVADVPSDHRAVSFGMREICHRVETIGSKKGFVLMINGQDIFVRDGNWIGTDSMLRASNLSAERYESEVALHAATNLNLLRVWGGGIAERPEFFAACDRHGMLVMQDFWISGEYTGPFSEDWQKTFLACARDSIKLLRNHPSLAFWSGGNETPPPDQVARCLRYYVTGIDTPDHSNKAKSTAPCEGGALDGSRPYVAYSTSGEDGLGNSGSSYGDGPYNILNLEDFFKHTTCPFNPEVGSVGTPFADSIRRMMSASHADCYPNKEDECCQEGLNPSWKYHTYIPYENENPSQKIACAEVLPSKVSDQVAAYGRPTSLDEFCFRAQLVNLQQYQTLLESIGAGLGTKYTGVVIWKTQNPWPGLRGSLYDWYLCQNGGFYGARRACEPVHVQMNRYPRALLVVNTSARDVGGEVTAHWYDTKAVQLGTTTFPDVSADAGATSRILKLDEPDDLPSVYFLRLAFTDQDGTAVSRYDYWLSTTNPPNYEDLDSLPDVNLTQAVYVERQGDEYLVTARVSLAEDAPAVAFGAHLQLMHGDAAVEGVSDARVLPAFYDDNFLLLLPGQERTVTITCSVAAAGGALPSVAVSGFNVVP